MESELKELISLLKEFAIRTDDQNKRLIGAVRIQNLICAVLISTIVLISFSYAFSVPYPEQVQQSEEQMQRQGGAFE